MLLWRKFEDKTSALYIQQKIRGFLHLYNGQEAILAGSIYAIDIKKDKMITAYRDHVQPIAMGVSPKYIMAELFGKSTGCSGGKGGSMHMFSKEHNFFGGHGIVGGQVPLGAGIAFADKYKENDAVTLCYMGDGAVRQGAVYEMPCAPVDGMDPVAVADSVKEAVDRARKGDGPTFLEMKTYRYKGHSMSDAQKYRTKDEVAEYQKIDPITKVLDKIKKNKWATDQEIQAIQDDVKATVKEAVDYAESSPFPSNDSLYENVYAEEYPFIKE